MSTLNDDITFNGMHGRAVSYVDKTAGQPGASGNIVAFVFNDAGQTTTALATLTNSIRDARTMTALKAITGVALHTSFPKTTMANVAIIVNDADTAGTSGSTNGVPANSVAVDCDDWSYPSATNSATKSGMIVFAYEPTTSPTDANTLPIFGFVYEEIPTGSTLNILVPVGGFWSAGDI